MDNSFQSEEMIAGFNQFFEGCTLEYQQTALSNAKIHCFFVSVVSEDILEKSWMQVSNFLALHFQNSLLEEFERWNMYVFYKLPQHIQTSLQYQIENDTFSSRKILVFQDTLNSDIIKEHILNTGMDVKMGETPPEKGFSYNKILSDGIGHIQSKKKVGQEIEVGLDQIISQVKKSK